MQRPTGRTILTAPSTGTQLTPAEPFTGHRSNNSFVTTRARICDIRSVIPEGAGPCQPRSDRSFGFFGGFWARRINGLGSRIGRRPTAERPKVLDANLGAAHAGPRGEDADAPSWVGPLWNLCWLAPSPVAPAVDCPTGCQSFLRRDQAAWSAVRQHDRRGQSARGDHACPGVMTDTTRADRETYDDHDHDHAAAAAEAGRRISRRTW